MAHTEAQKADTAVQTPAPVSAGAMRRAMLSEFWYYFSQNKGAVIGLVVFSIIVFLAVFAPLIAPHSPSLQNREALLWPPAWMEGGTWAYPLGTDALGRDIFSRLIFGARASAGADRRR